MARAFSVPWGNPDIDIHPEPSNGWHRVAVCGLWTPAHVLRKRWPEAAVVGPLRTPRGIDLLLRSLLANPQIRFLLIEGRDLTPNEGTRKALHATWGYIEGADIQVPDGLPRDAVRHLVDTVTLSSHAGSIKHDSLLRLARKLSDRPESLQLPPPTPSPTANAPHGDGDRIVGDTLADVWPRLLKTALLAGREIPTHYGATREILNLVSVIRDPRASVDYARKALLYSKKPEAERPGEPDPLFGLSWAEVSAYYERLTGAERPEGAPYSYGSRMRGTGSQCELTASGIPVKTPDQIAVVEERLREKPLYRGHYLTPWRPAGDTRTASGRPCLVGVQFRAVPSGRTVEEGALFSERNGFREATLHCTVTFRSHDLYGAYPLNLVAICLWLCEMARDAGMGVGTVTCLSVSAHVYERDWLPAQEVVAAYRPPVIRWDQRSSWRVEGDHGPCQVFPETGCNLYAQNGRCPDSSVETLRAIAMTPNGDEVIAVFEAPNPGALRLKIERSGLVTELGSALWLGAEIERVWSGGGGS